MENQNEKFDIKLVPSIIFLLLIVAGGYLYYKNSNKVKIDTVQAIGPIKIEEEKPIEILVLEEKPYINNKYGFQINLPKDWSIEESETISGLYNIFDPDLKYTSGILIAVPPSSLTSGIDFSKISTQDNYIKTVNSFSEKSGATIQSIDRVSPSSVIVKSAPKELGSIYGNNVSTFLFKGNQIGIVSLQISDLDKGDASKNILDASLKTFKLSPIKTVSPKVGSNLSLNSNYINIGSNDLKTYTDTDHKVSFTYPAQSSWEMTSFGGGSDSNQSVVFALRSSFLKGASKFATMGLDAAPYYSSQGSLKQQVDFFITGFPKTLAVTRNVQLLPKNIPSDVTVETIDINGYVDFVDGTQQHQRGLYMFAKRGNFFYKFYLRTDPEDYDTLYPLAASIISSIKFN